MTTPNFWSRVGQAMRPWPVGCRKPGTCERKRSCSYLPCEHQGRDIGADIDAAVARKLQTPPTANPDQSGVQTPGAAQGALEARIVELGAQVGALIEAMTWGNHLRDVLAERIGGLEARLAELEADGNGDRG